MSTPLSILSSTVLYTLGEPHLGGGADAQLSSRRKELVLLAYLARHAPRPVARETLATLLWGDRHEARARQSLRQALLDLRRVIGDALDVQADAVQLREGAVELDAVLFEREIVAEQLEAAVDRWHGDFLESMEDAGAAPFQAWLDAERERLRHLLVSALQQLASAAVRRGDSGTAERWASRWSQLFPLDERAHMQWMQVLRRNGRLREALSLHAAFVSRAIRELDGEPSAELIRLGKELEEESARTPGGPGQCTAAVFTPSLVERDGALAELFSVWESVRNGEAAIVLIEGERGVGKTRLAEEFLRAAASAGRCVILRGRGGGADGDPGDAEPFATANALFSDLREARGLAGAAPRALAELGRFAPWLHQDFLALPEARGTDGARVDALKEVLGAVAEERPVVVFLDEAPTADLATRRLLASLAHVVPPRVLVLLTASSVESRNRSLVRDLSAIRGVRRLKLQALSLGGVQAMIASMIALRKDEQQQLSARLLAETGGNPLLVSERVSALADAGWLAPDPGGEWRITPESSRRRVRPRAVFGAVAATLALLVMYVIGRPGDAQTDHRTGISVFPLHATVRDASDWSEALSDLLSTTLDGTPGLRVADPWAAWRQLRDTPAARARGPDRREAEALSRKAGTEWFLIGSVLLERGRLNVSYRLYHVDSDEPVVSHASEGAADSAVALAQRLAIPIIARIVDTRRMPHVGAIQPQATASAPALKAYLAAKEAMRRGLLDSAEVAVDRAIALDSAFGLALVEAAQIKTQVATLGGQPFRLGELAERAAVHSASLGERDRLRAQWLLASVRTEGIRAAAAAERLVSLDSTDLRAWAGLSYTRLVYGWQFGATHADAVAASEHVVQLDSSYVPGLVMRAVTAIGAASPADMRVQLDRLRQVDTTVTAVRGTMLALQSLLAPEEEMHRVLDVVEREPAPVPFATMRMLIRYRPQHAETLLARLAARWRGDPAASVVASARSRLLLAQGRGSAIDTLRRAIERNGTAALLPSINLQVVAARVAGVIDDSLVQESLASLTAWVPVDSAVFYQYKREVWWIGWLLGAYHATHGDTTMARRWHGAIGTLRRGGLPPDWPDAIRADIEARLAARRGDLPAALEQARRAFDVWFIHTENVQDWHPEPAMRFHFAQLLRASGKRDSAEAIFRSLVPPTTWVGYYTALASLELGDLFTQRGAHADAAKSYAVALRHWSPGGREVAALRDRASDGLRRVDRFVRH
ncbi:MAG: BTAD domain-containing putative transcriptional regulator [Gemmatimonadaceae bacterium]